jgi:hypothetical protein
MSWTAVGVGLLAILVAAGLGGGHLRRCPPLRSRCKRGGSIYLLYLVLAGRAARAHSQPRLQRAPMGSLQAIGFQLVNPKVWIFALGAMATFRRPTCRSPSAASRRPRDDGRRGPELGGLGVGGEALDRLIQRPRPRRAVSLTSPSSSLRRSSSTVI